MVSQTDRQRISEEVFAVTGEKLPADDPLVLAALFYAATVREAAATVRDAGTAAATRVTAASVDLLEFAQSVADEHVAFIAAFEARFERLAYEAAAERAAIVNACEARLEKHMHRVAEVKSKPDEEPMVPRWYLGAAFSGGAVAFALATFVACDFSVSWPTESAVGREFMRSLPSMPPKLKAELLEYVEPDRKQRKHLDVRRSGARSGL
jgi:hypothetical protein